MKAILINGKVVFLSSLKAYGNTANIQQATPEMLYDFGFREVVEPTITSIEKRGDIYFDEANNYFTYSVIQKTAEELAKESYWAEFTDNSATKENQYEDDGKELYRRIKFRVRRLYDNGTISLSQFNTVRRFLRPAVLPLTTGDWDIAKENVDALTVPTNTKLLAILNTVKQYINDYITANNIS